MKVRDIMRREPLTIAESDTLGNAQRWMTRFRIRHVPVIGEGRLVGMLSERDLLAARARAGDDDWWTIAVRDAMQAPPQTANPDDSITEIEARMADSKLDAFPIVDRGKLVGLVTVIDVLAAEVQRAMAPMPATSPIAAIVSKRPAVRATAPLFDAIALMYEHHVRNLPVVDDGGKLVGMLSEHDVRRALGDPAQYLESSRARRYDVQDVMDTRIHATLADRPVAELAHAFTDPQLDAVPIVDRDGGLVGVVSYIDALHALSR